MSKVNSFLGLLVSAILLTACSSDRESAGEITAQSRTTEVSVETALSNLRAMLGATAATRGETRSFGVGDVAVFPADATRAEADQPLAYIVNFGDGGYAILSADSRQAPILALVDRGSLTPQMLSRAKEAADAGLDVDAPTMMRASIVDYLACKTGKTLVAAETRAVPAITILEQQDSLMATAWSPAEPQFADTERTAIALLQTMVYNARHNGLYFATYHDRVLNWSAIAGVSGYRHFSAAPEVNRDAFAIMLFPHFNTLSDLGQITETLGQIAVYEGIGTVPLTEENVRSMVYLDKKPTVACFDGTVMEKEGWAMDGWLKMSVGGVVGTYVYCRFGKDMQGTDNGFYELEAATRGVRFEQRMLSF